MDSTRLVVALMVLGVLVCDHCTADDSGSRTELKIKEQIFKGYNSSVPPYNVLDHALPLSIELVIGDFSIKNAYHGSSEPIKLVLSSVELVMRWTDVRLRWKPSGFSHESSVVLDRGDQLWTPNFALEYTLDNDDIDCRSKECIVSNDGNITCLSFCSFTARCDHDVRQWPYGLLDCRMQLGSWTRINNHYELTVFDVAVSEKDGSLQNHHWRMRPTVTDTQDAITSLHNKSATFAEAFFKVARISTFYDICFTTPFIVLACMNLLVLWLPLMNNMRYVILMVTLFGHFLFIQQLSWLAPVDGDNTPCIVIFLRDSMLMTAFMLIFITITRRLASRQDFTPRWVDLLVRLIDSQPLVAVLFPSSTDVSCKSLGDSTQDMVPEDGGADPVALTHNTHWKRFCLILERICFVIYSLTYITLLFLYIPTSTDIDQDV